MQTEFDFRVHQHLNISYQFLVKSRQTDKHTNSDAYDNGKMNRWAQKLSWAEFFLNLFPFYPANIEIYSAKTKQVPFKRAVKSRMLVSAT